MNNLTQRALSRRQFLAGSGLAAAGLGLASLGLAGCGSSATPSKATSLTLVLDYTPNTNHTGIYVAMDQGYYASEGISLDVQQPPEDGADSLVGSGKAELGISYQDVMANYLGSDQPLPVTAVAAVIQHNTSGIMGRAADGITHPTAMENHTYATWGQDVEQAIVKSVVTTDGGDFSKVSLVPCNTTDEVASLSANEFDTVWVYEAWAVQNAKVKAFDYSYFAFADIDPVFDYYTPVVIANDGFLKASPDVAKAFLRATRKGYEYAAAHPKEAADILVKAVPELDSALVRQSQEFLADKYVADASAWGMIDSSRWDRFYSWMAAQGLTSKAIGAGVGFSGDYLA
jgi:ABC-type nitrate/sulfonate/bicarbonate transport system substrate-binding protein